jgi:hypothetical protein
VDVPPGAGDRAHEQRGGAGAAARRVVAEVERWDGERVGQPVCGTCAKRGGHLPPAGQERAGVLDGVLPIPIDGPSGPVTPASPAAADRKRLTRHDPQPVLSSPKSPNRDFASLSRSRKNSSMIRAK